MNVSHSNFTAAAIATGLIRSGRAVAPVERTGAVLRLARREGEGYYWLDLSSHEFRK